MAMQIGTRLLKRPSAILAAAILTALPFVPQASGQLRPQIAAVPAAADPAAGHDMHLGVYVNESTTAQDKLTNGDRMEGNKDWAKAAAWFQEIVTDKTLNKCVVPSRTDEKNNIIQYKSVLEAVTERLSKWPAEGLEVYRQKFEPIATSMIEGARPDDLRTLHEVFASYFVTESGKLAGLRMIDLYLESGEFPAAASICDRLLERHPNLVVERPKVLFRAVIAHHMMGDDASADVALDELTKSYANEPGVVAGKQVTLLAAATAAREEKVVAAGPTTSDSWPTVGGDVARSRVPVAKGRPGARVYPVAYIPPVRSDAKDPQSVAIRAQYEQAERMGMTMTVMPVVDRGQLFFQDGIRIYARQVESGVPLSGWVQTYGGSDGIYKLPRAGEGAAGAQQIMQNFGVSPFQAPRQNTLTLADNTVVAVMGMPDIAARFNNGQGGGNGLGTRLVCLDRDTGKEKWNHGPREVQSVGNKAMSFSGCPLVVGDNVYVIARGGAQMQGEECDVFCYDLNSGQFRWSCYVASSAGGGNMFGGGMNMDGDAVSHLAYASGRVYCVTNLGAVAAVDAYNGSIAWLNIYPREMVNNPQFGMMVPKRNMRMNPQGGMMNNAKPWNYNAALVRDGKLFVLPSDGDYLMIYDTASGRELQRIKSGDIGEADALLAVVGDMAIVAGDTRVTCLNWAEWEKKKEGGKGYWRNDFAPIKGRGFVTLDPNSPDEGYVFVPTTQALYFLNLKGGKVHPPDGRRPWGDGEGPGNVLVTQDHVIVATAKGVNVYTDLDSVEKKYQMALSADPGNIEARMVYSELMFNAGQIDKSLKTMDEAVNRLGGKNTMRSGQLRDRVFSDSITFAQRSFREAKSGKDFEALRQTDNEKRVVIDRLFERAAAAAETPSQQVNYRLSRAKFLEALGRQEDFTQAVALYQEMLSQQDMRNVAASGDDAGGGAQAGKVSENAITGLITKGGPGVYEKFENAAAQMLEQLKESHDPAKLQSVAENYPNSKVAREAMMLAAKEFEKADKPRLASQVLRRLYLKYSSRLGPSERATLNEAMARSYLKLGNQEAAVARLQRSNVLVADGKLTADLILSDGKTPLKLPNGNQPTTYHEGIDALQSIRKQLASSALPDLNIPPRVKGKFPEPFQANPIVINNVKSIALPPQELPDAGRYDRIIAWTGNQLACYAADSDKPMWTGAPINQQPTNLAWLGDKLLIWGANELAQVDGATGKALWRVDLKALQAVEVVSAGAGQPDEDPAKQPNQQEVLINNNMQMRRGIIMQQQIVAQGIAVQAQPAQPAQPAVESVQHIQPLTDRVLVTSSTGRLVAIGLEDGKPLWQTRLANRPIDQLEATDDFTVVRVLDELGVQLVVFDTFNGQMTSRMTFNSNQGQPFPINIALAPDGTLIWTAFQQIMAKDLYEPGDKATWSQTSGHQYQTTPSPDGLVLWGDQVLALCDNGMFVDSRYIRDGQSVGGTNANAWLQTAPSVNAGTVKLRLVGSSLYAIGAHSVRWYNLDHKANESPLAFTGQMNPSTTLSTADVLIGKDYMVVPALVTNAAGEVADPAHHYSIEALSVAETRSTTTGRLSQSGLLVYSHGNKGDLSEANAITQWQALQGGIGYVSSDEKLHLLKGGRE